MKFQSILEMLYKQILLEESHDYWVLECRRIFFVKSYYCKLQARVKLSFPHLSVWTPRAVGKVCCICLDGSEGCDYDNCNLNKRRITYVD